MGLFIFTRFNWLSVTKLADSLLTELSVIIVTTTTTILLLVTAVSGDKYNF